MYGAFRGSESRLSESALRHRVRKGELLRLFPDVYASPLDAQRDECHWEAALLSVPGGAWLCGPTAAAIHELTRVPSPEVHVAVPNDRVLRRLPGRVVHRPRHLGRDDVRQRRGLPVFSVERTLLDMAAQATEEETIHLLSRAIQERFTSVEFVRRVAMTSSARGSARLLAVLNELTPARNWFEVSVVRGLVDAGLPRPETGVVIQTPDGPRYPDGYYPKQRVALEADGAAFHFGLDEWGAGLERDDALAAVGVETIHLTYRQWKRTRVRCIERVARILAARS